MYTNVQYSNVQYSNVHCIFLLLFKRFLDTPARLRKGQLIHILYIQSHVIIIRDFANFVRRPE